MTAHGEQIWTTDDIERLVGEVEELAGYLRVGTCEESDGEMEAWEEARALVRGYRAAVAEMSSQA